VARTVLRGPRRSNAPGLPDVLHWQRDVVFGEDGHTARTGNGPVNLAILRNTVLTRPDGTGARPGIATLRARARKPERVLSALAS